MYTRVCVYIYICRSIGSHDRDASYRFPDVYSDIVCVCAS